MYDVTDYGHMIEDTVRFTAYRDALKKYVTPNSVVVDIGTGTGVFALLACKFGARRVFAIEPASIIEVARASAQSNGFSDRIEFIQSHSRETNIAEKADVIISDLRGVLPLNGDHLLTITDARERFLKPDGILIPRTDTLRIAPIEAPDWYQSISNPWRISQDDLDLTDALKFVFNSWHKYLFDKSQLLAPSQIWKKFNYPCINGPNFSNENSWTISRVGNLHGIGVWFDCDIDKSISFSNAPDMSPRIYGRAIFPLPNPEPVSAGDKFRCILRADLMGENYVWSWKSKLTKNDEVFATYAQSSFIGIPRTQADLDKRKPSYISKLSEQGAIVKHILNLMECNMPLSKIAAELITDYPEKFRSTNEAMACVAGISRKWCL